MHDPKEVMPTSLPTGNFNPKPVMKGDVIQHIQHYNGEAFIVFYDVSYSDGKGNVRLKFAGVQNVGKQHIPPKGSDSLAGADDAETSS